VELHNPLSRATHVEIVELHNVSTVYLSTNPVQHEHTKHIEIDLYFVRERITVGLPLNKTKVLLQKASYM
jgi:hypothetical protein